MDKTFFVQELEAHSGMLYRVAWTILRNDDACQDAMQEAALKAWEKRDSLRDARYFRTWITRILINACYDTHRRGRRFVSLTEVPEPSAQPPDLTLSLALRPCRKSFGCRWCCATPKACPTRKWRRPCEFLSPRCAEGSAAQRVR